MLAPPLATSWQTPHRSRTSRLDSALGRRTLSLGRPANPQRVTQARDRRLRTHGVTVSARPTTGAVTDVAYLPRESPRPVHVHCAGLNARPASVPRFNRRYLPSISFKIISRPHQHPNHHRAGPADARTVRPPTCARGVDRCSSAGSSVTNDGVRRLTAGRRLAIVVIVVGRRTIFVRARHAPPRGCFTAVAILARDTRQFLVRSRLLATAPPSWRSPRSAASIIATNAARPETSIARSARVAPTRAPYPATIRRHVYRRPTTLRWRSRPSRARLAPVPTRATRARRTRLPHHAFNSRSRRAARSTD